MGGMSGVWPSGGPAVGIDYVCAVGLSYHQYIGSFTGSSEVDAPVGVIGEALYVVKPDTDSLGISFPITFQICAGE